MAKEYKKQTLPNHDKAFKDAPKEWRCIAITGGAYERTVSRGIVARVFWSLFGKEYGVAILDQRFDGAPGKYIGFTAPIIDGVLDFAAIDALVDLVKE